MGLSKSGHQTPVELTGDGQQLVCPSRVLVSILHQFDVEFELPAMTDHLGQGIDRVDVAAFQHAGSHSHAVVRFGDLPVAAPEEAVLTLEEVARRATYQLDAMWAWLFAQRKD